ncbi:caspase family protein [Streptomyces sp. NPDC048629]|uniref:caspase family protein n=1 Tax=Streptomyces sp. NPDC048629 TaxID=3154824 RepID=UPI003413346C
MSEATGRRFLITIGVSAYADEGIADLPGVPQDVRRIRELLLPMGYEHVLTELAADPDARDLAEAVEEWTHAVGLDEQDTVAVYFAGHGVKAVDRHYLLCATTRPGRYSTALPTEDLCRPLMLSPVGHLLVMLDTCYAGAGSEDVAVLAAELAHSQRGPAGRWVLAAARGKERAAENAFVDALAEVLTQPRAGSRQEYLGVREVTERINEYFAKHHPRQHARHSAVDSDGHAPFFRNAAHIPGLPVDDLDVETLTRLRRETRGHFEARGRGLEHLGERGDHFTGRAAALSALTDWLTADRHDRKARVVTGDPGSGKSAVLGRLLRIAEGRTIVPLHARRAVLEDLVADLAAALRLPKADRDEVLDALGQRVEPVTVLVDALDEAGTAGDSGEGLRIAREFLQPLASLPSVRLVVGTRRPLIGALGRAVEVIDLDSDAYTTPDDVAAYALKLLRGEGDPDSLSPYKDRPEEARAVAEGVARRAVRSFLVARMTASALVQGQIEVDTAVPGWEASLPGDAKEAFAAYLARFGPERPTVERLLRPLAYAQGVGLPWSTLWAPLAEALSGIPCAQDDLRRLHEHAGAYVVETPTPDGASVFRLFHETMAEYLRGQGPDEEAHRSIAEALTATVRWDSRTGVRDWPAAHPYVLDHLSSHAAAGGCLDALLDDPEYLVHAAPAELLRALEEVRTGAGRLRRAVYRASAEAHASADPAVRRNVLSVDAARYGQRELALELAGTGWLRPRWATGALVHPALYRAMWTHRAVHRVVCLLVEGQPHAISTHSQAIEVWDLNTGQLRTTLPVEASASEVRALAATTVEGHPCVVVAYDVGVDLWDLVTETRRSAPGDALREFDAVDCTDIDGRPHAVLTDGADLLLWDLVDDSWRTLPSGHEEPVWTLACVELDGRPHVVMSARAGDLRVLDLADGRERRTLPVAPRTIAPSRLSTAVLDGRPHVVGYDVFGRISVWDVSTGTERTLLAEHKDGFNGLTCIDVDGQPHAVTVSDDETVQLWDLVAGQRRASFTGHTDGVNAVAATVIEGRPYVLTGGWDRTLRLWDPREDAEFAALPGHSDWVQGIVTVTLGERPHVVTAGADRTVCVRELADGSVRSVLTGHEGWIHSLIVTPDEQRSLVLTSSMDGTLRLWNLDSATCVATLEGSASDSIAERAALFSLEGRPRVARAVDREVEIWDLNTRSTVGRLPVSDRIRSLACVDLEGRPHLLTGHVNGVTQLWDLTSSSVIAQLSTQEGPVAPIVCAEVDGRPHAFIGNGDGSVLMMDLTTRQVRHRLEHHFARLNALAFMEIDGRLHLLSGGQDHCLLFCDLSRDRPEVVDAFATPLPIDAIAVHGDDIVLGLRNEVVVLTRA